MHKFLTLFTLFLLVLPQLSAAQMSSENFTIQGPAFSAPNATLGASSTNFQNARESGGIYIYDAPVNPTPPAGGSGSSGTRIDKKNTSASNGDTVLGKNDSVTICHSNNEKKYVVSSNVQVFVVLSESGSTATLRGHDGHEADIIPPFLYDLGDGVRTYSGKNWTTENQLLYADSCALFLAKSTAITPQPSLVIDPPVAPVQVPVDVCEDVNSSVIVKTAVGEDTLVSFTLKPGVVRSAAVEQSKQDYRLLLQVKPVSSNAASTRLDQLLQNFTNMVISDSKKVIPPGLVKKVSQTKPYQAPEPSYNTPTPTGGTQVINIGAPDCIDGVSLVETPSFVNPPESSSFESELQPEDSTDEVTIVVNDTMNFTDDDIDTVLNGVAVTPIEISVINEFGVPVESFEEPVLIDIFNPGFTNAEHITVLQRSRSGGFWYVVSHKEKETTDDTLTLELIHPGEVYVWFKPKEALASDIEVPTVAGYADVSKITVKKSLLYLLQILGGLSGITLIFLQLAAHPFSVTNIGRLVAQSSRNLFALVTFKKKRHPWGTVYDSKTKAPVDPALVEIFDESDVKLDQKVTDLDGRYGFLVPEGVYRLKVSKTNYEFPSRVLHPTRVDVLYHNLYFGGQIVASDSIVNDIPVDAVRFDWNQYEKLRTNQTKFFKRFDPFIIRFMDFLFIAGAALLVWQFVSIPTMTTGLFLAFYVLLLWKRYRVKAPLLYGFIEHKKLAVPYALVQIFSGDHEISRRVCDKFGRYFALVSSGKYTVKVSIPEGEGVYTELSTKIVKTRNGIINDNLSV